MLKKLVMVSSITISLTGMSPIDKERKMYAYVEEALKIIKFLPRAEDIAVLSDLNTWATNSQHILQPRTLQILSWYKLINRQGGVEPIVLKVLKENKKNKRS